MPASVLPPRTHTEIESLVRAFEDASFPLKDWHHREHLTVTAWYLLHQPLEIALERMRAGIRSYNERQGIVTTKERGYHDTITIFFVRKVAKFLAGLDGGRSMEERVQAATEAFADQKVILEYYSRDRIMSWEARLGWVEPDLKPIDEERLTRPGNQPPAVCSPAFRRPSGAGSA